LVYHGYFVFAGDSKHIKEDNWRILLISPFRQMLWLITWLNLSTNDT